VSAEPQTPLLPVVLDRIRHFKSKEGRILLSNRQNETTIYFGNLMQYFLWEKGVRTNGKIELGRVDETKDRLILRYISELSLKDVISELLKFSNNFVANQLLLSAGVRAHGAPGTLEKGIDAALSYSRQVLCTETIRIAEGSGISRENRISALDMYRVLNRFKPYRLLMPVNNGEFYKTGTLSNVSTRVGYLEHQPDQVFSFIVFLNTPGKTADEVMKKLHARLR
jgi:D-alanyl-D-alanine carboxypeptidase/D-alanyl-D-alanine-endopeptidase (penicillin-binding protein 4)